MHQMLTDIVMLPANTVAWLVTRLLYLWAHLRY